MCAKEYPLEWMQGYRHHVKGSAREDNPYSPERSDFLKVEREGWSKEDSFREWDAGWCAAEKERNHRNVTVPAI